jgi:hypothetical protein
LLWWVLWASVRADDQRKKPVLLWVAAGVVCFVAPIVVPITTSYVLPPVALMRILLLLVWTTIGVVVWTLVDRWRRRSRPVDGAAWVGVVIAVVTLAATVAPPLAGVASIGRPRTAIIDLENICGNAPLTVPDGLLSELLTVDGEKISTTTKDSELRFSGAPYYVNSWTYFYLPKPSNGLVYGVPKSGEEYAQVMENGDLRMATPVIVRDPLYGYVDVLLSLYSVGALEPSEDHLMHWQLDLTCTTSQT